MTIEAKRGRGRPPIAPEDALSERIEIKATRAQVASWTASAGARKLGAWLREVADRASKRRRP